MHTASSARATWGASRSASECAAIVVRPRARAARWMRNAISPRLAMRTERNIGSGDPDEELAGLHVRAGRGEERLDGAGPLRPDLVEHLHRLDEAQDVALLHRLAGRHEGRRA